jgi:hypothetical protein
MLRVSTQEKGFLISPNEGEYYMELWVRSLVNPLNAELNPICHLLTLLGGATIVVVSRLRVNGNIFFLSASQLIVGLYSQPLSGLLASSFEVSRSQTTTRHSR